MKIRTICSACKLEKPASTYGYCRRCDREYYMRRRPATRLRSNSLKDVIQRKARDELSDSYVREVLRLAALRVCSVDIRKGDFATEHVEDMKAFIRLRRIHRKGRFQMTKQTSKEASVKINELRSILSNTLRQAVEGKIGHKQVAAVALASGKILSTERLAFVNEVAKTKHPSMTELEFFKD